MNITLDAIDRAILRALQADGSLSVNALAQRLGMTPPPCWRRMRRLKDLGVLQRQVWIVHPESVDLGITIYATVKLTTHDAAATTAFREEIALLPEVLECYVLLGSIDVLLKIVVRDVGYYETFFYNRLSQIPGVREVTSSVVMTEVKKTLALPL
jgi:Lrp/AsnC family transcriptional regulator